MANTREEQAIVNTEPTPLDPSPKRVEGVADTVDHVADLGDTYGTLHKPALKIEKLDGIREQRAITNKAPEESPERHGVISAKKVILPNANSLVDGNGNPLISGGGSSGDAPRLIEIPYDFNEIPSEIISQLRVGDVVKSKAVVIGTVTYKDETDVTIVSIDASCVTYYYYNYASEDGKWVYSNMHSYDLSEMGGSSYVHNIGIYNAQTNDYVVTFQIVTKSATPFTEETLCEWFRNNEFIAAEGGSFDFNAKALSVLIPDFSAGFASWGLQCHRSDNDLISETKNFALSNYTVKDSVYEVQ